LAGVILWGEVCQPENFAGASAFARLILHALHGEPFRELSGKGVNFIRCEAVALVEIASVSSPLFRARTVWSSSARLARFCIRAALVIWNAERAHQRMISTARPACSPVSS